MRKEEGARARAALAEKSLKKPFLLLLLALPFSLSFISPLFFICELSFVCDLSFVHILKREREQRSQGEAASKVFMCFTLRSLQVVTPPPPPPLPPIQVHPGSTYEVSLGNVWSSMGLMEKNLLNV